MGGSSHSRRIKLCHKLANYFQWSRKVAAISEVELAEESLAHREQEKAH